MSRFWKIVLLVIAVLVVGLVGLRMLGGGKGKDAKADAQAEAGKDGERNTDPVPVTVIDAARQTCRSTPARWAR